MPPGIKIKPRGYLVQGLNVSPGITIKPRGYLVQGLNVPPGIKINIHIIRDLVYRRGGLQPRTYQSNLGPCLSGNRKEAMVLQEGKILIWHMCYALLRLATFQTQGGGGRTSKVFC